MYGGLKDLCSPPIDYKTWIVAFVLLYGLIFFYLWLLPSPDLLKRDGTKDIRSIAMSSLWVWLATLAFSLIVLVANRSLSYRKVADPCIAEESKEEEKC